MNYIEARKAIHGGRAKAHALWMLLVDKNERDGYGLKPDVWEGPGEYQRVTLEGSDDLGVLVCVNNGSFPCAKVLA